MRYSQERKEAVLQKIMAPHNRSIAELSEEEGVSEATLYNWRNEARSQGNLLPNNGIKKLEISIVLGPYAKRVDFMLLLTQDRHRTTFP